MMTVDPVNNLTLPGLSILKFHDINPSQSGTYKCSVKTALQSHSQVSFFMTFLLVNDYRTYFKLLMLGVLLLSIIFLFVSVTAL